MGYSHEHKRQIFEIWYNSGRPNDYRLSQQLGELVGKELDLPAVPSYVTIGKWRNRFEWEKEANERDALIKQELLSKALELRKQKFEQLAEISLAQGKAQLAILEGAQLDDIAVTEARELIDKVIELGEASVNQYKAAMALALVGSGGEEEPESVRELGEVMRLLDRVLPPATMTEIKLAMHARIEPVEKQKQLELSDGTEDSN